MADVVLDASAVLAMLRAERGGEKVPAYCPKGLISAINLAEVAQRYWRGGESPAAALALLARSGLATIEADADQALVAARLVVAGKPLGLSLADRFCLALALDRRLPVLTADRPFKRLELPLEIIFIR